MVTSTSRHVAIAVALVGALACSVLPPAAARPPPVAAAVPPRVSCRSCVLVDDRGRILWARRALRPRANASTTKMVTALVVAARAAPEETVTVSAYAAAIGGGGLDLEPGERVTVRTLLYALLLTSSNDAAVALAEHVSGSEAAFVATMNRRADRIGATRSRFVTPHGLDRPGHFSAARDLALVAERVLADPVLAPIVATASISVAEPRGIVRLDNRNPLLEGYRGVIGVKTGFTSNAGDVLVAAARRNGRRLIAVAMGSRNAASDCRALLDLGWSRLRRSVLLRRGDTVGWLVLDPSGSARTAAAATVRGMTDPRALDVVFEPDPRVQPPLEPGQVVGRAAVTAGGRTLGTVPAIVTTPVGGGAPLDLLEILGGLLEIGHGLFARPGAA